MTYLRLVSPKDRNLCFGDTGCVLLGLPCRFIGGTKVLLPERKSALTLAQ